MHRHESQLDQPIATQGCKFSFRGPRKTKKAKLWANESRRRPPANSKQLTHHKQRLVQDDERYDVDITSTLIDYNWRKNWEVCQLNACQRLKAARIRLGLIIFSTNVGLFDDEKQLGGTVPPHIQEKHEHSADVNLHQSQQRNETQHGIFILAAPSTRATFLRLKSNVFHERRSDISDWKIVRWKLADPVESHKHARQGWT